MEADFEAYRGMRGGYFWRLKTSNGAIITSSSRYYSQNGAKRAIRMMQADDAQFEVYQDKRGYFWHLNTDGAVLAGTGRYNIEDAAKRVIDLIKAYAPKASVVPLDRPPSDLTPEEQRRQTTLLRQASLDWFGSTRRAISRRPRPVSNS